MKKIEVNTKERKYTIHLCCGALNETAAVVDELCKSKSVFIITDSGVPERWVDALAEQLGKPPVFVFEQGEASKNIEIYGEILAWLAEQKATRKSLVVALGGGVTGDMAGFAAATYMRGIEYVNIPTTSLSQIDSSVGGKTAIDHGGIKNIVGAFHQPSAVIVDPEVLSTLSERERNNGLAEAVKAGLIGDGELFELFEHDDYMDHIEEIIERALLVKKRIVEEDEHESNLRKVLNFGHTFGHAYESYFGGRYLHGECVAMGMMTVREDEEIKTRRSAVLRRLGLPETPEEEADSEKLANLIMNDKKSGRGSVDLVRVREIGTAVIETTGMEEIRKMLK